MRKSQANMSRIGARASTRPVVTNMPAHLAPAVSVVVTGPVHKTRAKPGAGSSSYGYGGAWAQSADIGGRTGAVIRDDKWSQTVQRQNV